MARNSESTRMRVAVSIVENQIRRTTQPRESLQQHGDLSKAQEAWNVGKCDTPLCPGALNLFHLREAIHEHAGNRRATAEIERHVGPGNRPYLRETILEFEAFAQSQLNANRLARRDIPPVQL